MASKNKKYKRRAPSPQISAATPAFNPDGGVLHYYMNTGETYEIRPRDIGPERLQAVQDYLQNGEFDILDGRAVLRVSILFETMMAGIWGKRKFQLLPMTHFAVAPTPLADETSWPATEQLYLLTMETPLLRSLDNAAPRRPKQTPWCAWSTMFALEGLDHEQAAQDLREAMACQWCRIINGPPTSLN